MKIFRFFLLVVLLNLSIIAGEFQQRGSQPRLWWR